MPTVFNIRTAARLLDVRSAVRMVMAPAVECSSSGIQPPCGVSIGASRSVIIAPALMPDSIAEA